MKVSGKPAQYDDLKVFLDEQAGMKELVAASRLPKLTVDISDSSVTRVVEEIADWLEQTGGLYIAEKRAALW